MLCYCFKCGREFLKSSDRDHLVQSGVHDFSSYCDGIETRSHHPVPVESDRFHRAVWIERSIRGVFTGAEFRRFGAHSAVLINDGNSSVLEKESYHDDPILWVTRRYDGGTITQSLQIDDDWISVLFKLRRFGHPGVRALTHKIRQSPEGLHSRVVDALSVNFRLLEAYHEVQLKGRTINRVSDPMIQFGGTQ